MPSNLNAKSGFGTGGAMGTASISRVFSADKVVESLVLNAMGAQVFRTVAARVIYRMSSTPRSLSQADQERFAKLQRDGLLQWNDFLPLDQLERIKLETSELIRNKDSSVKRERLGANNVEKLRLCNIAQGAAPATEAFLADPRLQSFLEAAEKRTLGSLLTHSEVEHLTQGLKKGMNDPQSQVHSDIFFACHKAWLYLSDVGIKNGPLFYVKGSQKARFRQMLYIYRHGRTRRRCDDYSRRVTDEEMAELRDRVTICTCPANTLLIANVCGYHGRLQGAPGHERWAIHVDVRANPFRSLPSQWLGLRS
jgi:hypothetical protein